MTDFPTMGTYSHSAASTARAAPASVQINRHAIGEAFAFSLSNGFDTSDATPAALPGHRLGQNPAGAELVEVASRTIARLH